MNAPLPTDGADSNAVLAVKIDNLTQVVEHLRDDLKAQSETYVRKDVYETKSTAVDREIVALKAGVERANTNLSEALQRLEDTANARRIPWTAIGAFAVGGLGLLFSILPKLAA